MAMFRPAGYESDEDSDDDEFNNWGMSRNNGPTRNDARFSHTVNQEGDVSNSGNFSSNGNVVADGYDCRENEKMPWDQLRTNQRRPVRKPVVTVPAQAVNLEDFKSMVIRDNTDEMEKFLDRGIGVNEVLRSGWTALMYAGNYANVNSVRLLLEHGANPNFHADQYTVLMATCASRKGNDQTVLQCVQLLVDHGAKVNDFDRFHMTSLMYAAREGQVAVIKYLLEKGASKDKQDNRGYTSLSQAVAKGHVRVVQVLLEAGADVDKACCDGSTAVDIAYANEQDKIAGLLEKYSSGEGQDVLTELSTLAAAETTKPQLSEPQPRAVTKYGELELFLMGIEMNHLIPKFHEHKINFQSFLRFTDHDLQQIGVTQLGLRKKLLDSIMQTHKKDWQPSSLPSIQYNKHISCAEAIAMVANMSKHTAYMGSTAGYVTDQIQAIPDILQKAMEGASVEDLSVQTDEALGKVRVLYSELTDLRKYLTKEMSEEDFSPPDLISYSKCAKSTKRRHRHLKRRVLIIASIAALGVAVWKVDSVTNTVDTFSRQLLDWCSRLFTQ